MSTQIAMPCYCGSLVTFRSEALITSIYRSDWTGKSKGYKKVMLMFMERVKQPIVASVYMKLFYINLDCFVKVCGMEGL